MSDKEVKIDELSEGQLLLRSWWEEEGPHYHMCYTDRQYQRKAREERHEKAINYYNSHCFLIYASTTSLYAAALSLASSSVSFCCPSASLRL